MDKPLAAHRLAERHGLLTRRREGLHEQPLDEALPLKKPVPSVTMPHPGCCARETIHRSSAEYVRLRPRGKPSAVRLLAATASSGVEVAELPASSGGMASL